MLFLSTLLISMFITMALVPILRMAAVRLNAGLDVPDAPKKTAGFYLNRGWAFLNNGDVEPAIKDFTKAISIDSKLAEAYYGRGNAWLNKRDPQRALEDAKEALKLKPDVAKYDDFV
jgi:tetratricopeptide (TPR) repeat protein